MSLTTTHELQEKTSNFLIKLLASNHCLSSNLLLLLSINPVLYKYVPLVLGPWVKSFPFLPESQFPRSQIPMILVLTSSILG